MCKGCAKERIKGILRKIKYCKMNVLEPSVVLLDSPVETPPQLGVTVGRSLLPLAPCDWTSPVEMSPVDVGFWSV